MTGVIVRLFHVRGYGFIQDQDGDTRFLNAVDLVDQDKWYTLKTGQRVTFKPVVRRRKPGQVPTDNTLGVAQVVVE